MNKSKNQVWEKIKLGEICRTASGGTPNRSRKEYYSGNIPWVKSGELNNRYIFNTEEKITKEALNNSSAKLFDSGTLLIAMYGATAGKTSILKIPSSINQAICAIYEAKNVDLEFIRNAFDYKRHYLLSLRHGGAQPNLNQNNIKNFEIDLPPLSEQKAITKVLNTTQDAITGQEELIEKLKQLKRSTMQYLFTRGTKNELTKMTEIGEIPESWEIITAKKYCHSITDGTHDSPKKKNEGKYLVTSKNIRNGAIDLTGCYKISEKDFNEVSKRSFISNNDVIISMIGTIGEIAFIDSYQNDFCVKNVGIFKNIDEQKGKWLFYYLQSNSAKKYESSNLGGSTQKYIPLALLRNFPVLLPSKDEREFIVKTLSSVDQKIESAQAKLSAYQKLFKTLLHELMSGERRIK